MWSAVCFTHIDSKLTWTELRCCCDSTVFDVILGWTRCSKQSDKTIPCRSTLCPLDDSSHGGRVDQLNSQFFSDGQFTVRQSCSLNQKLRIRCHFLRAKLYLTNEFLNMPLILQLCLNTMRRPTYATYPAVRNAPPCSSSPTQHQVLYAMASVRYRWINALIPNWELKSSAHLIGSSKSYAEASPSVLLLLRTGFSASLLTEYPVSTGEHSSV